MKKNKQQKQDKQPKKKVSKILTNIKPYIINSFIAVCIFFITLYINDIAPFGKYTLAISDSYNQYEPMLFNFIKNIQEGTLTSFSFLNGLGNSTFFNYVYYLSSPINFLAVFFKSANSMFLAVITIKIIIATITSTFYAKKKTDNNIISTIVSVSYVFSAWFLAFNQSIMWLDAFIMFPLFQYGLEKLMNEYSFEGFTKLVLSIFSNGFFDASQVLSSEDGKALLECDVFSLLADSSLSEEEQLEQEELIASLQMLSSLKLEMEFSEGKVTKLTGLFEDMDGNVSKAILEFKSTQTQTIAVENASEYEAR